MAQLSMIRDRAVADCGATASISVDEALRRVRRWATAATAPETVPLVDALGRFLATDVVSPINVPGYDRAAMDGYAVHAADLNARVETRLPVGARVVAGHLLERDAMRGEAVRIFTGAPLPPGPDTVVMQEDCIPHGSFVRISPGAKAGAHIRRAGEDVRAGDVVLSRGERLAPQHLALAASIGCRELSVRKRLRVAVFSSGNELRDPGEALGRADIYDANRFALIGALRTLGGEVADLGVLPDDASTVQAELAAAARDRDVVLTSGAMSDGDEDHVKKAVGELGALSFWSLAIKPGRPIGMGRIGTTPFMGLPGNPVAAIVAFLALARPFALGLAGAREIEPRTLAVRSSFLHNKRAGRREYLSACLGRDEEGRAVARTLPRQGSHLLSSLATAEGFVVLRDDQTVIERGDVVDFLPLAW